MREFPLKRTVHTTKRLPAIIQGAVSEKGFIDVTLKTPASSIRHGSVPAGDRTLVLSAFTWSGFHCTPTAQQRRRGAAIVSGILRAIRMSRCD